MTILSLCDFTGAWSRPYAEAGYDVIRVDVKDGRDVRLFERIDGPIRGILAAPPCDHFAVSGARWWEGKGEAAVFEGLSIVDACLRIIAVHRPDWWALENPVGRLRRWLGPPAWSFDPCDFGRESGDAYRKRTHLWGHFTPPLPLWAGGDLAVEPVRVCPQGSWIQKLGGKSERTKALRSATPEGFARAFFDANR